VPEVRPVKSRVVPAGTVMPLRIMAEQLVFPLLAAAAVVKVQERFSREVAGAAETRMEAVLRASPRDRSN
jgi:hypothetical protein